MAAHPLDDLVRARSTVCELCDGDGPQHVFEVPPVGQLEVSRAVLRCDGCADRMGQDTLEPGDWFGLQSAIWSEVPGVQVTAWRLLHRLTNASWAQDLLDQAYLDDDTLAWAELGLAGDDAVSVVDSNGTRLSDGDTVTLIKDLDVRGANFTAKRGTTVKNIRVGDDATHVEGRVNGTAIYLKTEFLKRL